MLLRIAIVDDLPQDAERLQQALTAEGQTNIIRYESGDALLSAISPEQLDALGGVDAQVDDVQVTGDFVERLEFLAHAVDGIALFQQSLLDLVGVFFRVEGISHHGECIHLHDLFQIHLLQPPLSLTSAGLIRCFQYSGF